MSQAGFHGDSETRISVLGRGTPFDGTTEEYPDELMERGVRLVFESGRPVAQVARDLGVGHEVLRKRVRRAEADAGNRSDLLTSEEREEIRKLRRET
jgi:transposase-like protein